MRAPHLETRGQGPQTGRAQRQFAHFRPEFHRVAAMCQIGPASRMGGEEAHLDMKPILEEFDDACNEAFNRGDAAACAAFFTEDVVLLPPGQPIIRGRDAFAEVYERPDDRMRRLYPHQRARGVRSRGRQRLSDRNLRHRGVPPRRKKASSSTSSAASTTEARRSRCRSSTATWAEQSTVAGHCRPGVGSGRLCMNLEDVDPQWAVPSQPACLGPQCRLRRPA